MTKKAVVDIDNTLWHFCDALYDRLIKGNPAFPTPNYWTDWNFYERYCSDQEFFEAISDVHHDQDNDSNLPYPEAKTFLSTLKQNDYHIIIASHRVETCRPQTERWLEKFGLPYDELHLSFDKTVLFDEHTDVVVDDAPHTLEKAVERGALGVGLLFPWNSAYANNGFRLFGSLNDIAGYILKR